MQRIALKSAKARIAEGLRSIAIVERPRGFAIEVGGDLIRSQREDELTFLTIDGTINYVRRHLVPPCHPPITVCVTIPPHGAQ